jgi:hypothetical protein
MKESQIYSNQALITNYQSSEVAQPSKGSFDFPPVLVSFSDFWRLLPAPFSVAAVRDQKADAPAPQPGAQFVRIISLVGNKALGPAFWAAPTLAGDFDGSQGRFRQSYFRGRCRGNGTSQRNTLAVDHHHPLRALAAPGFPNFSALFLAGAKLASMKASSQSKSLSASSWDRKVCQIFNHNPCSIQPFKRRKQVEGWGYCRGRSCQRAPVRSIHRMPSRTSRLLAFGRPPLNPGLSDGNNGAILRHCSSVRNFGVAAIGIPPIFYYAKTLKYLVFSNS